MNTTIRIRDNYSNKLRDNVSAELKGIVDIQVKNKKTGQIEETQRHNMIVYGGREWLLRRAFGNMLSNNENNLHILNSCIKWVGFGAGGGEPGNPLQSGCTLGNDKDLYSPVRIRYANDNNNSQLNGYYASRVLSDGSLVPGYYKQISYVSLKEDSANPYVDNGIIHYPQLIAEVRIEISSDDCNGPNYSNLNNNVAYQDINEAALFVSDDTLNDPGKDGTASNVNIIPSGSNDRINFPSNINILDMSETHPEVHDIDEYIEWISDDSNCYPISKSQYFNLYFSGIKLNSVPVFIGLKDATVTSDDKCYVRVALNKSDKKINIYCDSTKPDFESGDPIPTEIIDFSSVEDLPSDLSNLKISNIAIKSNGTIYIHYENKLKKSTTPLGTEYPVFDTIQYRNTYNQPWTTIASPKSFIDSGSEDYESQSSESVDYESQTSWSVDYKPNQKPDTHFYIPCGYRVNDNGELEEIGTSKDTKCTIASTVRVNETIDTKYKILITGIEPQENSYKVKIYFDDTNKSVYSYLKEGMKFYMSEDAYNDKNYIPENNPATILEVYNPTDNNQVIATMHKPYFVIERAGIVKQDYISNPQNGIVYDYSNYEPYKMFSRVTFSSIRKTTDREIVFLWKIYF